jgi:hypothetical protein
MRGFSVALAACAFALAVSAAGRGGGVGTWTRVTPPTLQNIDTVGLARTSAGLQVVWLGKAGSKTDLLHTTILGNGGLGPTTKIVAGWGSLADGSIVATPSGLQAFFAGVRSSSTSDPYSSGTVFTATASHGGAPWALGVTAVAAPSNAYASDWVASTLEKDGTPVTAWTGTSGFYIHKGLDPATPNVKVQAACCAYYASLATDSATGEVDAAWYSNAHGGYGMHVRRVLPSLGPDRVLPGSASGNSAVSPTEPVGITGRAGSAGTCAAYGVGYPTWKALNVWCTSRGSQVRVWTGAVTRFTVAPALDGRVWAVWANGTTIYAARSNKAVTQFGAAVPVAAPHGTSDIWNVQGDGAASPTAPLDLLASVTTSGIAFWHTRVEPGLTLLARRAPGGRTAFSVLDAGDPVHGAKIAISGPHGITLVAASGNATATLLQGRYTAIATANGYSPAKAAFTVSAA